VLLIENKRKKARVHELKSRLMMQKSVIHSFMDGWLLVEKKDIKRKNKLF